MYLSADVIYPQQLVDKQLADAKTLSIYARGQAVLWTNNKNIDLNQGLSVLTQTNIKRIAIANPEHAPYGQGSKGRITASKSVAGDSAQIGIRYKNIPLKPYSLFKPKTPMWV